MLQPEENLGSIEKAKKFQTLHQACENILKSAHKFADKRWQPPIGEWRSGYFRDSLEYQEGPHLINTSTALAIIARWDSRFDHRSLNAFDGTDFNKICQYYSETYSGTTSDTGKWHTREKEWSPYASAWVLTALAMCSRLSGTKPAECLEKNNKVKQAIEWEINKLNDKYLRPWSEGKLPKELADFDHPYFVYTALRALWELRPNNDLLFEFITNTQWTSSTLVLIKRVIERVSLEFYQQMTFKLAGVQHRLDAVSLTLSLYCLLEYGDDFQLPEDVLARAMETIFSLQLPTGFWDTGTPLLGALTGLVGCSSVELAICLLRNARLEKYCELDGYIDKLIQLLSGLIMEFRQKAPEEGWPTDIRRKGNARQTWYGFMVFDYIGLMSRKLRELAAENLLKDFERREGKPDITFEKLFDYLSFKEKIKKSFIDFREQIIKAKTKEEVEGLRKRLKCSMILFGPPGTGKTSIAWALADALSWKFIELGPADFLRRGLDGIFAQGNEIFHRLMLVDRAVVLFDEVDELVLVRESQKETLSRFLTTYMLPWLQRLRQRGEIVFIFATNKLENYDPAIKRHGRFDSVLPIGPPQGEERARFLKTLTMGLKDKEYLPLANQIAPQATIGDIKRAWERTSEKTGGFNSDTFLKELDPSRLLITIEQWDNFLAQSKLLE